MDVKILSVQEKDITTKAGVGMHLRIVQGVNAAGEVFRFLLPKTHVDVRPGSYRVVALPFIGFECDLGSRCALEPKV